ncbi:MAG: ROK family protein [Elusimicrobiota bacterium]|nr:ROK family protein [Elusimicrobiota bacterium]
MKKLFAGIEAGGTKFVCAVGTDPQNLNEIRFSTSTPKETITKAIKYFKGYRNKLSAIGIGSFGPIDINPKSKTYGHITSTPKRGWKDTPFLSRIKKELKIPAAFDTDVNAAALGEYYWGAAKGLKNFIYLTIGTGIGGGGMINGKLMRGLSHPEMGHIFIGREAGDKYKGHCPFHKNKCLEGLACGPAVQERWKKTAKELGKNHKAWELQARYISKALINYICVLSPERIILGGGIMNQKHLLALIRSDVKKELNNYIQAPEITKKISAYIVSPGLKEKSGILGAIALAKEAYEKK